MPKYGRACYIVDMTDHPDDDTYIEQHKERLNYMPWLYWRLKPKHLEWAQPWQIRWQQKLMQLETVIIEDNCFISPQAKLFAEPGRPISIGTGSFIGADAVLHGPITIGKHVGINHHCTMDGGRAGIHIGDHCRIAAHTRLFAFNHGLDATSLIQDQAVTSQGIHLGRDVWLGAGCGIVDGVTLGDGAVVGMNATVTRDVRPYEMVAGSPARSIGQRQGVPCFDPH